MQNVSLKFCLVPLKTLTKINHFQFTKSLSFLSNPFISHTPELMYLIISKCKLLFTHDAQLHLSHILSDLGSADFGFKYG